MFPILLIAIFNFILYFPTLFMGHVMDDFQCIANIKKEGFKKPQDRLYGAGTFGENKFVDHLFTMALWMSLNVMVYFAFGHNNIALVAAILCSCHPLNNQLSIWLNGRRYLVCAMLLMACMLVGWKFALPFYLLSALFQTTIFFAPVLFAVACPWSIVAIGVLAFIMKDWIIEKIRQRCELIFCEDLKTWKPGRPVVVVKLFGFYFWKMFFPGRVEMIYSFIQMFGRTKEGNDEAYRLDWHFVKGVLGIVLCGGLLWIVPVSYKPLVVFMFLALLQWCAIISVTQLISDRYASIACIFMCFFISFLSFTYLPIAWTYAVIGFILGQYLWSTITVFKMYKDLNSWYEYHIFNGGDGFGNLAVVNMRIGILLGEKRLWQAFALIEKGLEKYPKDYALNYLGYIGNMIVQAPVIARRHIDICRTNMYLGEEDTRKSEIDDADLGLRALLGELNIQRKK